MATISKKGESSKAEIKRNFTYQIRMYVPDPRGIDKYFTYDGTVDRTAQLDCGREFDALLQGLVDHIYSYHKVRVNPQNIVIQQIELIDSPEVVEFDACGVPR